MSLNKQDLISFVSRRADLTLRETEIVLNALLEAIVDALADGGSVKLTGFGSFEVAETKERVGRNPGTGETITIPAGRVPKFRAGKTFKEKIQIQPPGFSSEVSDGL